VGAILSEIQRLYELEARLRTNKASPAEILRTGQSEGRPIYQRLHRRHIF
jgi:hypothetical protein